MDIRSILSDHGIEDARTASVNVDMADINKKISDLDTYIDGAFYDGIIQEIEVKRIETYIATIKESNAKLTELYTTLYNHTDLENGAVKDELFAAKANYDLLYQSLITDINTAISDGLSTPEEATQIDEAFFNLTAASARLEKALEMARDAIIGKRTTVAEQNANLYADGLIDGVTKITGDLDKKINSMEGYVDGTFRDGIVTEMEAKNIQSYLDSLRLQKTELDKKYDEIYNNYFLSGIPKLNLLNAKTGYDEKHLALVNLINAAIADSVATVLESDSVRQGFVELDTALSLLVSRFEHAIEWLSQERANEAERLAKEGSAEYVDGIIKDITADDKISRLERSSIKDAMTRITGIILGDTDSAPTIATIDLAQKGELYSSRKEAFTVGMEVDHLDVLALESAYTDLATYLDSLSGLPIPNSDLLTPKPWDTTSVEYNVVDKLIWRTKWLDYYLAVAVLKERISEKIKGDADALAFRVETAESSITTNADEISFRVKTEVYEIDKKALNDRIDEAENKIAYNCDVLSTNGYVFKNGVINTTVYAVVYRGTENVTDSLLPSQFIWKRISADPAGDEVWNSEHVGIGKSFAATSDDVNVRATFTCDIGIEQI